ncbi:TetR/AcrR family transcriptional regulator [Myceligenerans pegani]|uniref:Helix-turn-helix transcriptional regulator n=1 Tax=Myceligenerans pegani TaxID=2776917 RepID=A0ABR9N3N6_9MICO|nr:TetR/AcrR family transcriptional regulator [Myceligenerans sp. TRM 65318]MBE1878264.1 helix-turn-helix transcriptional regulator [Myceligenerans sp. TRM 65318]MBE3020535.1 helix-turn-helix transcriptional regulator [Myceligenerans sp. TRM 65318]
MSSSQIALPEMSGRRDGDPASGRKDRERNRRRILESGQVTFRDRGIDTPVTAVARRAGLAPSSVHRHFPTKRGLVEELARVTFTQYVGVLRAGAASVDPLAGLAGALRRCVALQAAGYVCTEGFVQAFPDHAARYSAEIERRLDALLDAAVESGQVRRDVGHDDLRLLLEAVDGVVRSRSGAHEPAQRLVTHFLRAVR